jgi:copper(I)-binding protein
MRHLTAALIALSECMPAQAASTTAAALQSNTPGPVPRRRVRPTPAVYLTLVNNGSVTDRLIGASSPVADKIQFHEERDENGVSKMRALRRRESERSAQWTTCRGCDWPANSVGTP